MMWLAILLLLIVVIILLLTYAKPDNKISPILSSISDEKCSIEEWGGCCCNCKNHLEDFHHCCTTPGRQQGTCYCNFHRGWICIPDGTRAHSGWSKHGYCELHIEVK